MTSKFDLYCPGNILAVSLILADRVWKANFMMATAIYQRVAISGLPEADVQTAQ